MSLNSEGRWFLVRTHLGYWDAFRVSTSASCSSVELVCKTPRKDYGSRIIQSMIDYSSMIGYVRQSTDLCWSLVTHQKDATNCANRRSLPLTSHDLMSNKNHCTQHHTTISGTPISAKKAWSSWSCVKSTCVGQGDGWKTCSLRCSSRNPKMGWFWYLAVTMST